MAKAVGQRVRLLLVSWSILLIFGVRFILPGERTSIWLPVVCYLGARPLGRNLGVDPNQTH